MPDRHGTRQTSGALAVNRRVEISLGRIGLPAVVGREGLRDARGPEHRSSQTEAVASYWVNLARCAFLPLLRFGGLRLARRGRVAALLERARCHSIG